MNEKFCNYSEKQFLAGFWNLHSTNPEEYSIKRFCFEKNFSVFKLSQIWEKFCSDFWRTFLAGFLKCVLRVKKKFLIENIWKEMTHQIVLFAFGRKFFEIWLVFSAGLPKVYSTCPRDHFQQNHVFSSEWFLIFHLFLNLERNESKCRGRISSKMSTLNSTCRAELFNRERLFLEKKLFLYFDFEVCQEKFRKIVDQGSYKPLIRIQRNDCRRQIGYGTVHLLLKCGIQTKNNRDCRENFFILFGLWAKNFVIIRKRFLAKWSSLHSTCPEEESLKRDLFCKSFSVF